MADRSLSDRYDYLKAAKASIYNNAREGGGGSWGRFEDQRGTWKGKGTCRDKGTVASARGRAGGRGLCPQGEQRAPQHRITPQPWHGSCLWRCQNAPAWVQAVPSPKAQVRGSGSGTAGSSRTAVPARGAALFTGIPSTRCKGKKKKGEAGRGKQQWQVWRTTTTCLQSFDYYYYYLM